MKRAATVVPTTLVAACFLLLIVLGFGPRTGWYQTLTVLSGSMEPSIPTGALILVAPKPVETLEVGEVITFHDPVQNSVVTHRVHELDGRIMRTKGDANPAIDPWDSQLQSEKAWTVRIVVPRLGSWIAALRSPAVSKLTVSVVPLLIALLWIKDLWTRENSLSS